MNGPLERFESRAFTFLKVLEDLVGHALHPQGRDARLERGEVVLDLPAGGRLEELRLEVLDVDLLDHLIALLLRESLRMIKMAMLM